ncbi:MAG: fluoride efflux transporter CrcB, partial [Pseudomonadota bacterium]
MMNYAIIAIGGALGAMARYATTSATTRLFGQGFPAGTIIVNVAGSFAMGFLIGWLASRAAGDNMLRLFFATGFLGAFTTFSAFSLDFAALYERGAVGLAAGYAAMSVVASILAVFGGLWLSRAAM